MQLLNQTTGKPVARKTEVADTFWKRFRGLMMRRRLAEGGGMLFKFGNPGRYGIHMFFMRFPIDLVYLDSDFLVVELKEKIKPWRIYRPKNKASYLVELPAGTIKGGKIKIGQKISPSKEI
ncbi:MAG: DUF192 domain-containing protein [Candidatus Hadarchaeota archaeon]